MSAVWLPQPGAEVACVAKILLHPIVQSAKMGHNYTLLLHQRSLEENIRCFNISIAAWIFKSSFMSSMIHLKTNSACQRKGDREAKGRH